jgi:hypothetical protein
MPQRVPRLAQHIERHPQLDHEGGTVRQAAHAWRAGGDDDAQTGKAFARLMRALSRGAYAGNGLDETRTDALVPQPETGKISCVHHPRCGRLSPGACQEVTRKGRVGSRISVNALDPTTMGTTGVERYPPDQSV